MSPLVVNLGEKVENKSAPILESYVQQVEGVLSRWAEKLGNGKARPVKPTVLSALADDPAISPIPHQPRPGLMGESEILTAHQALTSRFQQYQGGLDASDDKVGTITSKAASASNSAFKATETFLAEAGDILDGFPSMSGLKANVKVKKQFEAITAIDEKLGTAEKAVSEAYNQLHDPIDMPEPSAPPSINGGSLPSTDSDSPLFTDSDSPLFTTSSSPPSTTTSSPPSTTTSSPPPTTSNGSSVPYIPPFMPMSHSPSRSSSRSRGHGVRYTTAVGHADPLGEGEKVAAEKIYERLRQHGLTHEQAVGILGNLQVEAPGFDTGAWNGGESSYGLAQWRGGRLEGLYEFAARHPLKDPSSWEVQVDYIVHELHTSESNAYAHLQTAQTPTAAAAAFDQFYERSSGEHRGRRIANANQFSQTMRLPAPGSSFQSERPAPDVSQMV